MDERVNFHVQTDWPRMYAGPGRFGYMEGTVIEITSSPAPLRILHVEDDVCVTDLVGALREEAFDLIFSDYSMPSFDGLSALKIAQQRPPDLPFIFVSGTINQKVAEDSLRNGAADYVFKHERNRLVPSVRRVLDEGRTMIATPIDFQCARNKRRLASANPQSIRTN